MKWSEAVIDLIQAQREAKNGDVIEFLASDSSLHEVVKKWCEKVGERVVRTEHGNQVFVATIRVASK